MPPQGRPQAAGRSSQFQPGKYEIFPGRGMSNQKASQKPARSQPEANQTSFFDSQKPAKPGKRGLRKRSLFRDVQGDRRLGCFASPRVELCHLLCFVCGRGSASTRPPPGSGEVQPHQFQDMSNQKARSQPQANQTSFFARSQPNQARGLSWQGSLGLAEASSLFRDVQGEIDFASPRVELCHLLCFVCGRGSASTRPPPGSGEVQPVSAR